MRRKALLMGMAVVTSLPGAVLAKGVGRQAHEAHAYAGSWGGAYAIPGERDEVEATPTRSAAVLSYLKSIMAGANYRADDRHDFDPKGWRVELMAPRPAMDADAEPVPRDDKRLGLGFRFTF
ncbi:MAG: hypothetical protein MUC79_06635 [Thiobacillaceae bacterium]|jgi:hypothetical protein|nr:hypothetical protein [Thiobacillaceae bacterium]